MKFYALISRVIIIASLVIPFCLTQAKAQLNVDDYATQSDMRGYTTYHQLSKQETAQPLLQAEMSHQPILDQKQLGRNSKNIMMQPISSSKHYNQINVKKFSAIEKFYRDRTKDKTLSQYGYDLLKEQRLSSLSITPENPPLIGAVQDDYVLQAGDKVNVIFSGELRKRESYIIESDGTLFINDFGSFNAMGQSIQSLEKDIKAFATHANYRGEITLTVANTKQINALIIGQIHTPGRHQMNAFQSVLDAIITAGGVRKTGSMRNIKLIRRGKTHIIDLYDYLIFEKNTPDLILQDGDKIIVPPLGDTFAITGDVKQAGVFELPPYKKLNSLKRALFMSGGVLGGGDIRYSLAGPDGIVTNVTKKSKNSINNGAILNVIRSKDRLANAVELLGYSRKNGIYDLKSAGTLHHLMGDRKVFGDNIYPLVGVIARINRDSLIRTMMGFSPQAVALAQDDRQLESGDKIYLFSHDDIADIFQDHIGDDEISQNLQRLPKKSSLQFPKLVRDFIIDNAVTLQGAVRNEGQWPVGTMTDLKTLISVAGGLTSKASRSDIEITSRHIELGNTHRRRKINAKDIRLSDVMLEAGDQVRVNERYEQAVAKTVRVTGEIKQPGSYDLMRGDTLLTLLERAGGLTPDAYPPAAVFSRKAERKREEQKFRAAAQELERTVSVNLNATDKNASLTPSQISMARQLADDLRSVKAVGRVTIESDPTVLSSRPELNMLLEDGDHLHIPKRSLNVRVAGEVMNPASLLFEEDKEPNDYIREAGGKSYYADTGRMFVVYPDGSAQPLKGTGWGSNKPAMVIPGSTIIVPRDPKPFSFIDSFKDITQILTNMAITGVFVEDIATDEN